MDKPTIQELEKNVDCRYALVVAVSKRARVLVDRGESDPDYKPVIQSMHEMADSKYTCDLHYDR